MKAFKLPTAKCLRCKHEWIPKVPMPLRCAKCNSPYWMKERRKHGTA